MNFLFKKIISSICAVIFIFSFCVTAFCNVETESPSYILMDEKTGEILLKKDENAKRPIASVTKIMTMLITFEEIEKGNISLSDKITASGNAAGMGGSQVYLKENEEMTLDELIKTVFVSSANDSCVAIAERLCGNTESFVMKMNEKAKSLGLKNTSFKNPHGLDEEGHFSSCYDLAVISRELMKYDIEKYTTIWQDTIRDGTFTLSNTNKLIRFYPGATGLKTGSTSKAGYCMSATAKKGNMELIAVVLGAETSKGRFNDAKALLEYGFSNYKLLSLSDKTKKAGECEVIYGKKTNVSVYPAEDKIKLIKSSDNSQIKTDIILEENIKAPVKKGQKLGKMRFLADGKEIDSVDLICGEDIAKKTYFDIVKEFLLS